jgi:hypothetical protein
MTEPHGPLHGVKVVACSTAQAGTVPYMLMADLGAEVIKIEVPEVGDNSRGSTVMPGFPSTYFETNNRGVKSVTLNLKTGEGREILRKLVAKADIFGQNFRPGAAEKNGFGYEELRKVNPKLVYMSVSGYGPRDPMPICRVPIRWRRPLAASRKLTRRRAKSCAPASSPSPTRPVPSSPLAARSLGSPTHAPRASAKRSIARCSAVRSA